MHCSKCGHENAAGQKFCGNCGNSLAAACSNCGAENPPGNRFCGECGSHLYLLDERWPEGVWPNAAALDSPLPDPPEHVHLMLRYKPEWVPVPGEGPRYPEYPKLSIAEWHAKHGLAGEVLKAP